MRVGASQAGHRRQSGTSAGLDTGGCDVTYRRRILLGWELFEGLANLPEERVDLLDCLAHSIFLHAAQGSQRRGEMRSRHVEGEHVGSGRCATTLGHMAPWHHSRCTQGWYEEQTASALGAAPLQRRHTSFPTSSRRFNTSAVSTTTTAAAAATTAERWVLQVSTPPPTHYNARLPPSLLPPSVTHTRTLLLDL
jgi:hypothetical protein